MLENLLVFKFEENETEFSFQEKLNIVTDEKLIKALGKENIKNGNSTLQIKSLNLLPIYDVIQLKINVLDTGTFLVNFEKEKIDENSRNELISKIKNLKNNDEPTKELQIEKIKKLLMIIEEFHPIYATYRNTDILKLSVEELKKITDEISFTYPLLFLVKTPKEKKAKIKEEKPKKNKKAKLSKHFDKEQRKITKSNNRETVQKKKSKNTVENECTKSFIDFPLFNLDYLFVTIFSILLSFGFLVALYKNKAGENISIFLFIMSALYVGIIFYTIYTTLFKRTKEKYKNLKYWIVVYIIIGIAIGTGLGFTIIKYVFKNDEATFNYSKMIWTTIRVTLLTAIASIPGSLLINWIIKKIKK